MNFNNQKVVADGLAEGTVTCKCGHGSRKHSLYEGVQGNGMCLADCCGCEGFEIPVPVEPAAPVVAEGIACFDPDCDCNEKHLPPFEMEPENHLEIVEACMRNPKFDTEMMDDVCSVPIDSLKFLLASQPTPVVVRTEETLNRPSLRQIVFNWMQGETDLTKVGGWWGGSKEVAEVDRLLAALNMSLSAHPTPLPVQEEKQVETFEKWRRSYTSPPIGDLGYQYTTAVEMMRAAWNAAKGGTN